ncbi:MAG: response regulator, partial [Oligoflexia bacterium]|nr:response regulator [Oligoflexia bacterium]
MNPKFLIVDDDPSCTDLLATMLQSLGCESVAVHSGTEALSILSNEVSSSAFDAVFLDIMMPDIDGLQVLTQFRAMPHGTE